MKKFGFLIVLVVGCASTTVDPDNGVNNASYRSSITKGHDSVAAVVSKLEVAKGHARTEAWWDAIHDDLAAVRDQFEMTLRGAK